MIAESISITNFKSINKLSLSFSENIYALIGKNETGKSNILQAINCLYGASGSNDDNTRLSSLLNSSDVELVLKISERDNVILRNVAHSVPYNKGGYSVEGFKQLKIRSPKKINDSPKYIFINSEGDEIEVDLIKDQNSIKLLKNVLLEIRPSIEYYEREDFLIRPAKIEQLTDDPDNVDNRPMRKFLELGGIESFGKFEDLSVEDLILLRESVAFNINKELSEHFRSDYDLKVMLESHNGELSIFFRDQYLNLSRFSDRSAGFQYFFSFLINKLHAARFNKVNTILLLDEPGTSLHPNSQKRFIRLLESLSSTNTILYTTHSPFSLNRMYPSRVWLVERDKEKGTFIQHKSYANNWRLMRTSLGITFSDSFVYSEKTLLVEGVEDKLLINSLIHYFVIKGKLVFNSDMFSIIEAGSIDNMPAMVQILLDEERPMFVLTDNDVSRTINKLMAKAKSVNNEKILTVKSVADIKNEAISIEDLLPKELYLEAVKNYLKFLVNENAIVQKDHFLIDALFGNVADGKIYSNIASEICKNFKTEDGHELNPKTPISKVGIAHEFGRILNQTMELGTAEEEVVAFTLVNTIASTLHLV